MRIALIRSVTLAATLLLLSLHATSTAAQEAAPEGKPPATMADAFAKIQAGDFAAAAAILDEIVVAEPKNLRALRLLGLASIRTGQYDKAISSYGKSLEIEKDFPASIYNSSVAYALKGDKDAAFTWLERVRALRRLDMSQIAFDADLASLRDDPRFKALLPKPDDFKAPFVEEVKILKEWDGESANAQFGWIARKLGDVDKDGIADIVTSAPTMTVSGAESAGRVYVYSTKSGKLLWQADGAAGDQLGTGLESAGDTNRDGIADVIAGAPGGCYAVVYSGRDGKVLLTLRGEKKEDQFGQHAGGVGDVDGDGRSDVIVGAPFNATAGTAAGRAYLYSGKTGKLLLTLTGEEAGDRFGSAVTGARKGKRGLVVVGAPGGGKANHGSVYVYDGHSSKPSFTFEGDETGNALGGMFLSTPDVDGDGTPDVYASDWSNAAKGPSTGRIYVHSGASGKRLLTLTGENAGEGFGTSPSSAGDLDGDGHDDLAVGAWQHASAAGSGGRIYIHSGADGRLLRTITCRIPGDTLGFDSVGMGDIDGDGMGDLLVTSAWSGVSGFHSGRVFIVSSGVGKR